MKKILFPLLSCLLFFTACNPENTSDISIYKKYEAEDAEYGSLQTGSDGSCTYVNLQSNAEDSIIFKIESDADCRAFLKIKSKGNGGQKENNISVNDELLGSFTSQDSVWEELSYKYIKLQSGENTITISASWGWISLDYIELVNPKDIEMTGFNNFVTTPCDKNANDAAKNLMSEIAENYGKKIITGQMDLTWYDNIDMAQRVYNDTGKYPKLMGYDFMNYVENSGDGLNQTEEAIAWHKKGGYIHFCWHWRITGPNKNHSFNTYSESDGTGNGGTDFTIPYTNGKWDTSSSEYNQLINDMDIIAEELKKLQQEGVPVLWRPLHEASGNIGKYEDGKAWFWWGDTGPEAYIALYRYMFDYFTNEKGLHNLIWIWNGQEADWYPGDKYVDIVGYDIYDDVNKHKAGDKYYQNLMTWCGSKKMAAISEAGYVPSTEALKSSSSKWLYYMIWNDDDSLADDTKKDNNNFWGGTKYNKPEDKTTNAFDTDYQIKLGDTDLKALFNKMGVTIK